jgi:thiol-disulfide isomerase/thioredoxin
MKRIFLAIAAISIGQALFAQQEISRDGEGNKVIRGFISRQELMTDTSFAWFRQNQHPYTPVPAALQALRANRDSIYLLAFGGTWCSDTKFVLPKLFVLADAAGLPPDHLTVIGVDHNKETIQHLSETFHITNVPTIIVLKNGKEMGRVIEYGEHGLFDETLGEVIEGKKGM